MERFSNALLTPSEKEYLENVTIPGLERQLARKCKCRPDRDARSNGASGNGVPMPGEDCREENVLASRIERLRRLSLDAQLVEPPKGRPNAVAIGTIVTIAHREGRNKRVRRSYHVVGYEQGDCYANPPRVSYLAPVVKEFMGQEVGARVFLSVNGRMREHTLTSIRRPK